jgi:Glu-tRNA(Gln) amidotransferase subunit E-like FAD-binding protein
MKTSLIIVAFILVGHMVNGQSFSEISNTYKDNLKPVFKEQSKKKYDREDVARSEYFVMLTDFDKLMETIENDYYLKKASNSDLVAIIDDRIKKKWNFVPDDLFKKVHETLKINQ